MTKSLGVVMDPIDSIQFKKDSTLAILLAAQARKWALFYMEAGDLFLRDGVACARMRELHVHAEPKKWFDFGGEHIQTLTELNVVLMRKDPPFNLEYIYLTYILERAEASGVRVVNRPQSLRDANEKMFTAWFPQCCPPTLVTRQFSQLKEFLAEQKEIVVKPLDGMGGACVFRVKEGDPNTNVIFETITEKEKRFVMAQRFLPEIIEGDKRILVIDGEPVPYALARIPAPGESRGNLAAGAKGVGVKLTARDRWLVEQVAPVLKEKGLLFVGLDVIGDYITEINVTSPTTIRELDRLYELDIGGMVMQAVEKRLGRSLLK
jgi:glutathione synthase